MKLSRINIVLGAALVVVVIASAMMRVDHSQPNYEVHLGDDMAFSPAYKSFERNPVFANHRTIQPPIPGTIARGALPLHFEATPEEAVRAGQELASPYEPTGDGYLEAVERGQQAYAAFCVSCHGGGGAGDGPVAQRGFPPPPSLLTGKSTQMKDGQLFHILTYGQGSMAPFAGQLSPDRRWDAIAYVRSLQQAALAQANAAATSSPLPDSTTQADGDSAAGEPVPSGE